MAGFLDFLGGAAQSVANAVNEDRQRQQIEAFQERLRAQELADYEKKEAIRARIARENRAGEIVGSPQVGPTGDIMAFQYDQEGRGILATPMGAVPWKQEMVQEREREILREETKAQREERLAEASILQKQESALLSRERRENPGAFRAPPAGEGPPSARDLGFMEDRARRDAALEEGFERTASGQYVQRDPANPGEVRVATAEERARIERKAKASLGRQSNSTTSFDADSFLSQFQ